jgi:periplasmic mercuric ion binding protein
VNGKIINGALILGAAIFLTILAIHVRAGVTADSVAVLRTSGMTCGSCSSKISAALQTLNGVAATEVDVDGGWVIVGYDTKAVKPETLAEKVRAAGFDSRVHVVLTPAQFKQMTGQDLGLKAATTKGCCGACTVEHHK